MAYQIKSKKTGKARVIDQQVFDQMTESGTIRLFDVEALKAVEPKSVKGKPKEAEIPDNIDALEQAMQPEPNE